VAGIVVLGEALIDVFAGEGVSLGEAKTLYPSPGGAPANVAVALARLGADVGFIGKVGADDYGSYLIDLMASEGVDTTYLVADPGGPTMLAIVATPSPAEQTFILYNGANTLLRSDELDQNYITSARVFVFGSVTLASDSRQAALQTSRWAKEAGKQVIFDVNLRPLIWPNLDIARRLTEEALATTTVVKLNKNELEFLTGTKDLVQGSHQLLTRGIQLCCVSLGKEGAYFTNGKAAGRVPSFFVDVRDTTGCGDAFVAGLAFQLNRMNEPAAALDESSLGQVMLFANACGGLSATQQGAMSALPTLAAVKKLLQGTPYDSEE
jgi:fructokinase